MTGARGGTARDPARLPPPTAPGGTPKQLVGELARLVGEAQAARWCADLLAGADRDVYRDVFGYLGPNCAAAASDPAWPAYWRRTWGARGLLYAWTDIAEPAVVAGLGDPDWRPAEMCLKVAARRELGAAGARAARLVGHELPRVRAAAIRCLGIVGDTEHAGVIRAAAYDPDPAVGEAAARAAARMVARLDLAPDDRAALRDLGA